MHDVDLDPALAQGPRDPKTVEARLVAHNHAPHVMAGLGRLVLPLLDRPERAIDVPGLELARGTTRHTRHDCAGLPRLAAQFQNGHEGASLVKGGRGFARIESFAHRVLLLEVLDNL